MAKRKSRRNNKPQKKKTEKLEKEFNCPFCNHEKSVECELNKEESYALISCRICGESYCTQLTPLTEPIDVYSEWIDECECVNHDAGLTLMMKMRIWVVQDAPRECDLAPNRKSD